MSNPVVQEDLAAISSDPGIPWERLRGKTVLISGANGFLPAYLVQSALYRNDALGSGTKVLALVRNASKARTRFAHLVERTDFELLVQDVCEPVSYSKGIDFVIHAASQATPKYYGSDPVGTANANLAGTQNLLKLAHEKKSEGFLYFSSSEVYGSSQEAFVNESSFGPLDPTKLRACYAESKRMGENLCVSWAHQFGVPVTIVRPFHTYGPGMALDDGRVFADFVADIIARRDLTMKSDGSAIRAYCYLADATRAFWTVLLRGKQAEAYNVGNPAARMSVLELAEALVKAFPERGLKVIRKEQQHQTGYLASTVSRVVPDTEKIQALGWTPRLDVVQGFKRTVESFL